MSDTRASLYQAIGAAQALNEPGEVNAEYARGQAELIVDLFGLDMDPDRDRIYKLITHQKREQARLPEPQPGTVAAMPPTGKMFYAPPSAMVADQDGLLWLDQGAQVYDYWRWPGQSMKLWRDGSGRFHVEQPQNFVYRKTNIAAYPGRYTTPVYTLHSQRDH